MKGMSIAFILSVLVAASTCAPEGTRDNPAKFTPEDAMRSPRQHVIRNEKTVALPSEVVHEEESADSSEKSVDRSSSDDSANESKRLRRSLKTISDSFHGKSSSALVAIPISLGAKTVSGKKAGSAVAASAAASAGLLGGLGGLGHLGGLGGLGHLGHLGHHLPSVGVLPAAVLAIKALPIVKPVVAKVHLAGSVLGAKAHFASKFIHHKVSKF